MLPDFANMAGLRLPDLAHETVAKGVNFHHHSDREFHRLRRFRDQESWTLKHMLEHGLRRGPARGVAHVGVELSLDGALVASKEGHDLYRAAVVFAAEHALDWANAEDAERFETLMERLLAMGVPDGYRDPQIVSDRLIRILKPRPLLRLTAEEAPILYKAVPQMHTRIDDEALQLMSELRREL